MMQGGILYGEYHPIQKYLKMGGNTYDIVVSGKCHLEIIYKIG